MMYINNRWYTETEVKAYVDKLIEENEKLKELLKAAFECIGENVTCDDECNSCDCCMNDVEVCDYDNRFKWIHHYDALKLIGEDGERNG